MRQVMYRIINRSFDWIPNQLVYFEHRSRRQAVRRAWRDAPYYLIHIPKSGGQSVAEALSLASPGHVRYCDLPTAFSDEIRDLTHLAVIRDPLQRLRSTFRYAHMVQQRAGTTKLAPISRHRSLGSFIREGLEAQHLRTHYFLRPAVDFLAGAPRQRLRLIPFERLQEGVDAVHAELRLSPILLPRKNVMEAVVPLDLTIDPPEEQIVRSLYAADFELHRAIRDCAVSPWPDPPH